MTPLFIDLLKYLGFHGRKTWNGGIHLLTLYVYSICLLHPDGFQSLDMKDSCVRLLLIGLPKPVKPQFGDIYKGKTEKSMSFAVIVKFNF